METSSNEERQPLFWSGLMRTNTISNMAVEFLETRPEQAFGAELAQMMGPQSPQYAPEIDKFVAASDFNEPDYFKESEEKMTKFKATLAQFCKTLEERKLGKKLGIEIKNPDDYKMQDVLSIAQQLQSKHQDDKTSKGYLGKIRRCFRRLMEHRGILHNILSFIPNDSYGSVISGGFTIILAAIDRAEDLRGEICSALAEIPTQLEQINATINIHKLSRELKKRADSVFIAIFELLESIVAELSRNFAKKAISVTLKGERYGNGITGAIEVLKRETKAFDYEAQLCDSKRLGRVEEHAVRTRLTVEDTSTKLGEFREEYKRVQDSQNQKIDELQQLGKMMVNHLYRFLASNPSFNSRDGTVDPSQVKRKRIAYSRAALKQLSSSALNEMAIGSPEERHDRARRWLASVKLPEPETIKDMQEYLEDFEMLTLRDKDKVKWIVESGEIKDWISVPASQILAIEADTPPQDISNPLSVTSAFLSKTISMNTELPVLIYMGGLGTTSSGGETCGSVAMMKSFIAQLLLYIAEHRPNIDLEILKSKRFRKKSPSTLRELLILFGRLLDILSEDAEGNAIFLVIDSITRFEGSMEETTGDMSQLLDAVEQSDAIIKILMTDLGPPLLIEAQERDIIVLSVPDDVDGERQDLSMELLDYDVTPSIEDLRLSQIRSNDSTSDKQSELSFDEDEY
ncbi:uncharacterized protein GGS22DRAFT_151322 [Annulohypoxylon maeteangense]|uniref:uncharacterized protein n=1 Tax=Annulohypoxylon maeteangense TaxID=1927788 RepID=UPI002007EB6B|nr:uncharacterized protein GGS22DRAFT_151322 [Annulohypoxylon maeteangense]KAI0890588.1 hypothetical protein GGS22DRAFT_151322 [Annulohypoxylon maeteangense]